MISRKLMTNKLMMGSVAGVILGAGILTGYTLDSRIEAGRDYSPATVSQSIGGESRRRARLRDRRRRERQRKRTRVRYRRR